MGLRPYVDTPGIFCNVMVGQRLAGYKIGWLMTRWLMTFVARAVIPAVRNSSDKDTILPYLNSPSMLARLPFPH